GVSGGMAPWRGRHAWLPVPSSSRTESRVLVDAVFLCQDDRLNIGLRLHAREEPRQVGEPAGVDVELARPEQHDEQGGIGDGAFVDEPVPILQARVEGLQVIAYDRSGCVTDRGGERRVPEIQAGLEQRLEGRMYVGIEQAEPAQDFCAA